MLIISSIKSGQTKRENKMFKINTYVMPIHNQNGSTVCTGKTVAMKQRVLRLKRELKINLKQQLTSN